MVLGKKKTIFENFNISENKLPRYYGNLFHFDILSTSMPLPPLDLNLSNFKM
jgi:hypothetical protein